MKLDSLPVNAIRVSCKRHSLFWLQAILNGSETERDAVMDYFSKLDPGQYLLQDCVEKPCVEFSRIGVRVMLQYFGIRIRIIEIVCMCEFVCLGALRLCVYFSFCLYSSVRVCVCVCVCMQVCFCLIFRKINTNLQERFLF